MPASNLKNRIGIALTIGIFLAILILLASPNSSSTALLRGDFPGFYVLAKIIASNQANKLYDLELQREIQNLAWPLLNGKFLISVYPPSLALVLSPLGHLSALSAQALFSITSFLCFLVCFFYLKVTSRFLEDSPWLLFALLLSNPLLLVGTLGGQNTAFSIAIITSAMALLDHGLKKPSVIKATLAGIVFSLWLFKPQFGIFVLPALIFFRLWSTAAGFLMGALIHYVAGVLVLGPNWISLWLSKIAQFSSLNYNINLSNQASPFGAINIFLAHSYFSSSQANLITAVSIIGASLILLAYLTKNLALKVKKLPALWLFLAWIPLAAPQTLFYDIGITYFSCLMCLQGTSKSQERPLLGMFILLQACCWLLHILREDFKNPFFALISMAYFWLSFYVLKGSHEKRLL